MTDGPARRSMSWLDDQGIFHADGPSGNDTTLCGDALEGENGDTPMVRVNRRINCPACIATIDFCKTIRERKINREFCP